MKKLTISAEEHRLGIDTFISDHVHFARWTMIRFPAAAEKHVVIALTFNEDSDVRRRQVSKAPVSMPHF